MSAFVISDIHMGIDSKTNWYQKAVHEPYLIAALDFAIRYRADYSKVIVLGDLFDFWTYEPQVRPPSFDDILATHPNMFARNGKFAQLLGAFGGEVYYLKGNHDINVTEEDIKKITDGNHSVKMLPDVFVDDDAVYTHGHLFTMFNAPDPRPGVPLPIGHFVSRCVAHHVMKILRPGQTVADLPDWGVPSQIKSAIAQFFKNPSGSATDFLIDVVAKSTGVSMDLPVILPDGSSLTLAQAKNVYNKDGGLFHAWVVANAQGQDTKVGGFGWRTAVKAALADYDGTYMAWFATRTAFQNNKTKIYVGHTHIPKFEINGVPLMNYVNTGFECPPTPLLKSGKNHFNFGKNVVHSNVFQFPVKMVKFDQRTILDDKSVPKDDIVFFGSSDYSIYISIFNNTDEDLVHRSSSVENGNYVVDPPKVIPAQSNVLIWAQDLPFPLTGTRIRLSYSGSEKSYDWMVVCPFVGANVIVSPGRFYASAGKKTNWGKENQVPKTGHPLSVITQIDPEENS